MRESQKSKAKSGVHGVGSPKRKTDIMNTNVTSSQPFDFSGSIPMHYDQFSGPLFFEPYAIEVSSRIDPSAVKVALELASGTGRVTRHLRNVLQSSAKLIASTISLTVLLCMNKVCVPLKSPFIASKRRFASSFTSDSL